MKAKQYADMTSSELNDQLKTLKSELFNLRFAQATGSIQNPLSIRETRRNIARVKTILRQREMQA